MAVGVIPASEGASKGGFCPYPFLLSQKTLKKPPKALFIGFPKKSRGGKFTSEVNQITSEVNRITSEVNQITSEVSRITYEVNKITAGVNKFTEELNLFTE